MKPVRRNPLYFDALSALDNYGQLDLNSPDKKTDFVKTLLDSIEISLKNKTRIYGKMTEEMFKELVNNLGKAQLIKQEDAGSVLSSVDPISIPDFRVVLNNGSQILIEVKNFYRESIAPFKIRKSDFDGLVNYAGLTKCSLKFAIYWAAWNVWTLVPPTAFKCEGKRMLISLVDAYKANEMVIVGDLSIATKHPLAFRLIMDRNKPRTVSKDGWAPFTIGEVEIRCAENRIDNPLDKKIAWHLMLYGKWQHDDHAHLVDNQIDYIEHQWNPVENDQQDFGIIASLSGMFSAHYRLMVNDEKGIKRLHVAIKPELFGNLIPLGYTGVDLPLCIMFIHPKK